MNKKQLSIFLSKLKTFENPDVKLEQYNTDSEVAAEVLWAAYYNKDVEDKIIADLWAGSGIFGIGALLLNAGFVYFVEKDKSAATILKKNLKLLSFKNYKIINNDISGFAEKADVVIENPPFGTKEKHIDKKFLEKAMSLADSIYSIHKITSEKFIKALAKDYDFSSILMLKFNLPIKKTLKFHKKPVYNVQAGCWKLNRKV